MKLQKRDSDVYTKEYVKSYYKIYHKLIKVATKSNQYAHIIKTTENKSNATWSVIKTRHSSDCKKKRNIDKLSVNGNEICEVNHIVELFSDYFSDTIDEVKQGTISNKSRTTTNTISKN
jgi:hypothetical protein